jgi:hypothetical protein
VQEDDARHVTVSKQTPKKAFCDLSDGEARFEFIRESQALGLFTGAKGHNRRKIRRFCQHIEFRNSLLAVQAVCAHEDNEIQASAQILLF